MRLTCKLRYWFKPDDDQEEGVFREPGVEAVLAWYRARVEEYGQMDWFEAVEFRAGEGDGVLLVSFEYLGEEGDDPLDMQADIETYLVDPDDDGNYPILGMDNQGEALVVGEYVGMVDEQGVVVAGVEAGAEAEPEVGEHGFGGLGVGVRGGRL